jgi:myo-inositol-1(or 4)-monophosphatase
MSQYREFAVDLARQAGKIIKENFGFGRERTWKEDNSPLTSTDELINQLVIDEITKHFPMHSILAEEGSAMQESEYTWVCDPIDGTFAFSHAVPTCVFSLALVKDGDPVLGVIYDPHMDRMYVAEKGKGASVNGSRMEVSKKKELKNAGIALSTWTWSAYPLMRMQNMIELQCAYATEIGSIANSGALTACGEFDAVVFTGSRAWDVAAVCILVTEAGGKVTDLFGNEQRYDQDTKGIIASNGQLHEQLLALIKEHGFP